MGGDRLWGEEESIGFVFAVVIAALAVNISQAPFIGSPSFAEA